MAAPTLVSIFGVGPDTAAALLISAGVKAKEVRPYSSLKGRSPMEYAEAVAAFSFL